jgi:hypothetical protein
MNPVKMRRALTISGGKAPREPGFVLAEINKRLAGVRHGREFVTHDIPELVQRAGGTIHNVSQFLAIPVVPAQEDFAGEVILAGEVTVYRPSRTPAASAISRMLVASMPLSAKSEVATRRITGCFVSGFCSTVSIC